MKSLLIAIGTNKALICYRALILFYSVPFWQFSSKLGNLDWNNGINSSAVMLYKLPGMWLVSSEELWLREIVQMAPSLYDKSGAGVGTQYPINRGLVTFIDISA